MTHKFSWKIGINEVLRFRDLTKTKAHTDSDLIFDKFFFSVNFYSLNVPRKVFIMWYKWSGANPNPSGSELIARSDLVTRMKIRPLFFTENNLRKILESHKYWCRMTCFFVWRSLHFRYGIRLLKTFKFFEEKSEICFGFQVFKFRKDPDPDTS